MAKSFRLSELEAASLEEVLRDLTNLLTLLHQIDANAEEMTEAGEGAEDAFAPFEAHL